MLTLAISLIMNCNWSTTPSRYDLIELTHQIHEICFKSSHHKLCVLVGAGAKFSVAIYYKHFQLVKETFPFPSPQAELFIFCCHHIFSKGDIRSIGNLTPCRRSKSDALLRHVVYIIITLWYSSVTLGVPYVAILHTTPSNISPDRKGYQHKERFIHNKK